MVGKILINIASYLDIYYTYKYGNCYSVVCTLYKSYKQMKHSKSTIHEHFCIHDTIVSSLRAPRINSVPKKDMFNPVIVILVNGQSYFVKNSLLIMHEFWFKKST